MLSIQKNNRNNIMFLLIYILSFIGFFNMSGIKFIEFIGFISIFFLLFFSAMTILIKMFKKGEIQKTLFFILVLLVIWSLIIFAYNIDNYSILFLKFILMTTSLVFFMFFSSIINITKINIKYFNTLSFFFVLIIYISILLSNRGIDLLYKNPASLAYMCFQLICLSVLVQIATNKKTYWHWSLLPALYISNGRNQMMALLIIIIIYILWEKISKTKTRYLLFGFLNIFIIFFITYIYPKLKYINFFKDVDMFMVRVFNKRLFSGRDDIWEIVINFTKNNSWFGIGHTNNLTTIASMDVSVHNQFLQIYMQNGIIGIILCTIILIGIWLSFYKYRKSKIIFFTGAYFWSYMYINVFSVSLFENLLMSAVFAWMIFGFALNFTRYNET